MILGEDSLLAEGCTIVSSQCFIPNYIYDNVTVTTPVSDGNNTTGSNGAMTIVAAGWRILLLTFFVCLCVYIL